MSADIWKRNHIAVAGEATRMESDDGLLVWQAAMNGEQATYVTRDPNLVLRAQGIVSYSTIGVALVDETGERLALSIRSRRVPFD